MKREENIVKIFEKCLLVKGYSRGCVFDIDRGLMFFIDNSTIDFVNYIKDKNINEVINDFDSKEDFNEYLNFLIDTEIVFLTNEPESFPYLNLTVEKPFLFDVLLMEVDNFDELKQEILTHTDKWGVSHIALIFKEKTYKDKINEILAYFEYSKIHTITIYLKSTKELEKEKVEIINTRLRNVYFFNAENEKNYNNIFFTKKSLLQLLTRRVSKVHDMIININAYLESINNNLFYNRRVYIDNENNVKHSIEEKISHGNLRKEKIDEIIVKEKFIELWNLSKDQIEDCRHCEFRYFCPDNRIPEFKDGKYINIITCNYDYKTNSWK